VQDDPWGESVGKVADGVGSVVVDVADVDVEVGGVLLIVANDVDIV